ncbi:Beta-galactosidase C-terminal domain [Aliiglaciecola aliphaticivorans]
MSSVAEKAKINTLRLPKDIRIMQRENLTFVFNYASEPQSLPTKLVDKLGHFVLGSKKLAPYDLAIIQHANE